jgi:chromosome segregation ATPase
MDYSMLAVAIPEQIAAVSVGTVAIWIVAITGACVALYKYLEKYRELRNKIDIYRNAVDSNKAEITSAKEELQKMKCVYDNELKSINENIDNIRQSIEQLMESQNSLVDYQHSRDRADLKDQIREYYDVYHRRQTITVREKETLMDLIDAYERAGGKNSFVHTLVLPEIPTWKEEE